MLFIPCFTSFLTLRIMLNNVAENILLFHLILIRVSLDLPLLGVLVIDMEYVKNPGEGNGNPLQYSCLENPMDGGAW